MQNNHKYMRKNKVKNKMGKRRTTKVGYMDGAVNKTKITKEIISIQDS